ncbi:Metallo-dependent phosphatase-like protein [Immersiella caudata]|uniref:Metallo-dependent phosphatase-like protein n=1 Tax=Immersiella caudata TaxID=314043 RepID=A0AA39WS99_9PEZI|nr:Metallo-dependent phosphatase-like protein [Immersiella caudata]
MTSEGESVTFSSGRATADGEASPPDFRILHYNDVYHLDPSSAEPVGGVARFVTLCREYREGERFQGQPSLVTLFSGDVFNPSLESSITKGNHMVSLLNTIGTDCACVGNHDLDFGVAQFRNLSSKCKFPWLLANVLDPALGENVPLGNAKRTHMITTSNGLKIGLIGLGEREWLDTINSLPPDLIYLSASAVARELVPQLRAEGADLIIALTHQREPNDNKLAANLTSENIDLILGGHDHFYAHSLISGTHVLRSGSDFKQLSYIEVRKALPGSPAKYDIDIIRRDIIASIPADPPTTQLITQLTSKLHKTLEKPIGWTASPLDARFTTVRTTESNLGNFVCDIMRAHYNAECALMASGTIRGDQIYAPGPIKVKDITNCFPFEDPVVVIRVKGSALREALENGVSLYPALEGRFPQVSGIKFTFDPSQKPGQRITSVEAAGAPLDPERVYTLSTRGYMGRGKDGYKSLLVVPEGGSCEEIVSEENGMLISAILRQYFMSLKVVGQWKMWTPSLQRHWGRVGVCVPVITRSAATPPVSARPAPPERKDSWAEWTPEKLRQRRVEGTREEESSESEEEEEEEEGEARLVDRELGVMRRVFHKWCRIAGVRGKACDSLTEEEVDCAWTRAIKPVVEGRICMVGKE